MLEQSPGVCHLDLFSWCKMSSRSDRQDPHMRPERGREKWRWGTEVGKGVGESGRQVGTVPGNSW